MFPCACISSLNNNVIVGGDVSINGVLDMTCGPITDVSYITFCNGTELQGFSTNTITVSGDIDMSCNQIEDISRSIYCDTIRILSNNLE